MNISQNCLPNLRNVSTTSSPSSAAVTSLRECLKKGGAIILLFNLIAMKIDSLNPCS